MEYGQGIELSLPYPEAVQAVKAALKEQGFGVLTEIDVKATMREKIDGTSRTTSSSAPAIPTSPRGPSTSTGAPGCCCRATSSSAMAAPGGPSSRCSTRIVMVAVAERDELAPVADEAARLLSAALSALWADNPGQPQGARPPRPGPETEEVTLKQKLPALSHPEASAGGACSIPARWRSPAWAHGVPAGATEARRGSTPRAGRPQSDREVGGDLAAHPGVIEVIPVRLTRTSSSTSPAGVHHATRNPPGGRRPR